MVTFFQVVWSISAILLIVLVLLHSPKGDGLGIGGQGQLFSSVKSAEDNLNRFTWTVATAFIAISVLLGAGWLNAAVK